MTAHELRRSYRVGFILFIFLGIAIFYFMGCSTTKPPSQPQATAPQKTEAVNKRLAKAPVSQSSSLEQMQQGSRVGTPASSPLKDIYFDFDRYDLREDTRATLKANADWLKKNPAASVQIEGHCDECVFR